MIGLRVLKAATVCAFLVLLTTAWVFRFDPSGYNQTLHSLRASSGDSAYIFIAIFSVVSLLSMPIFGMSGVVGMIMSRRLGRSAFMFGLVCCALSGANLVLWKKYGGMPAGGGATGPTPVTRQASQDPPKKHSAKGPQESHRQVQ